jgi:hypothetical protein
MSEKVLASIETWNDLRCWLLPRMQNHFSVEEFAALVGRRPFSVREWCRRGRIIARKSLTRAGPTTRWVIDCAELERFRREGLLPVRQN